MSLTDNPDDSAASAPFDIAGRRIYPQRGEAVVGGERRRIEPRHMKVLLRLASGAGETVERSSLLDAWGEQVVGDDSLTQAISKLRRALDDQPGEDRLIETVPKIGYRLTRTPQPIASPQDDVIAAPTFRSFFGAAASWTGAHARAVVLSSAVLVSAAAFGWHASELMLAPPQSTDAAEAAEAPGAPPQRRIIIKMLGGRTDSAPSARSSIDI